MEDAPALALSGRCPGLQALGTDGYRLQVKWAVGKSKEREVADRVMTEVENCHAK